MLSAGSVKHLECWYWRVIGHCDYDENRCLYAHRPTGQLASKPIRREAGRPAVAGRNADQARPVYRNWRGPQHGVFDTSYSRPINLLAPANYIQAMTSTHPCNAVIPEPWATNVRHMKSAILYSMEDLHKGMRLWHISEEDSGPGAQMMSEAFWKHCHVMIGTLDTMAEMVGQNVSMPTGQ